MKLKRFQQINERGGLGINLIEEDESNDVKDFLFKRYRKYFPDAKSFDDIKEEQLSFRKIADLIEEYCMNNRNIGNKYNEEDLRNAFYKGREQKKLGEENFFIRPTFNGYLRELDNKENPYELWNQRVQSYEKDIKKSNDNAEI